MRFLLPRLKKTLSKITQAKEDLFQEELRSVLLIMIGTVILFELLGLHSIIGGFFAGLVLSESITERVLVGKIRAISYGIFIPTFFILIGIHTNISVFFEIQNAFLLVTLIVVGSMLSKFVSGILGAKIVGFNDAQAVFFGASSIPQLSTTLAVSFTAKSLGIISNELNTAFVALSIFSTLLGPMIMSGVDKKQLTVGVLENVKSKVKM
jgi:Kef-type K+ transport system membrane component KefB